MAKTEEKINRIKELVEILNKASDSYYSKDEEIMSNFEYDALYDELVALEEECEIHMANSPTSKVGYAAVDFLPKETHEKPMLSLNKTKSVEELSAFVGENEALISWKLDGLTMVLTYENGELSKAVTRGNGEVGEVVTPNAKTFVNLPLKIAFKGKLIVRGEAVISYPDFEKVNEAIDNPEDQYKNPRNLCSGSVRQLNSEVTASRHVRLIAYTLVDIEGKEFVKKSEQVEFLSSLGFETVEYYVETGKSIADRVKYFAEKIKDYEIPSDGLVVTYDDIEYSQGLGRTAKFPRDSIAFKWQDETAKTVLREIEWSPSRTGLINPVAIFDTVELEGTSVSRASIHNISVMEGLELGIGDEILVFKANMIIPQIAENLTKSGNYTVPGTCPCCGGKTEIRAIKEAKSLYCTNEDCPAKQIKKFSLFVSRDAMNFDGLSEATLEKFVEEGFVKEYSDLFKLSRYKDSIVNLEGFGEKSYNKLIESADKALDVSIANFIYSLGILNVGLSNAKIICRAFDNDINKVIAATYDELAAIDNIGEVIAKSFTQYFLKDSNMLSVRNLLELVRMRKEEAADLSGELAGKTVVITGSLNLFSNRKDLVAAIELKGGKAASSVSKNTFILVNNDIESASSKNKTAKELGIPIMSEAEFVSKYLD
ncbi:MAG: NAD-dependent DNA ligase LigA [Lachnospiraceae bacterium]|nr:NAD-dependent DNA ligase LigA [Lachnospiraceae bacterium]